MAIETGVIILAAGKGSRLNCQETPKAMVSIRGRPILARGLEALDNCGFTKKNIAVVIGHLGNSITEYCGSDVNIARQTRLNGNAEAVENGLNILPQTNYLVVIQADDCLTINDSDIRNLITFHINKQDEVTALLSNKPEPRTHKKGFVINTKKKRI